MNNEIWELIKPPSLNIKGLNNIRRYDNYELKKVGVIDDSLHKGFFIPFQYKEVTPKPPRGFFARIEYLLLNFICGPEKPYITRDEKKERSRIIKYLEKTRKETK